MNIVVGSAFRNSAPRLGSYLARVEALRQHVGPDHSVRVIAAEGDSIDTTRAELQRQPLVQHVACDHGGPWFGSTEAPERMVALSKVCNSIFEAVNEEDDVLVYVESDLLWDPATIGALIDAAANREGGFDVFAPLIYAGKLFYDIWGFRHLDGTRFSPFEPLKGLHPQGYFSEVGSVGSCLVMRGEVARRVRVRNDYCLVGWCEDARRQGYKIAACPAFSVEHPA